MKYIALTIIALTLSSCAILDKLTGKAEITVPTPTEDIRGSENYFYSYYSLARRVLTPIWKQ